MSPPFHQTSLFENRRAARLEKPERAKAPPACQVCGATERLNARICRVCEDLFGRRDAELLARARFEFDFAVEAYRSMTPRGQARFRTLLGDPTAVSAWKPGPLELHRRDAAEAATGPGISKTRQPLKPAALAKCTGEDATLADGDPTLRAAK